MSSASVGSIPFLSFTVLIFAWNFPLISLIFLKRSLVFPIILFPSISLHWKCKEGFVISPFAILWNSAFKWVYLYFSPLLFTSLLFSVICKASSVNPFAFLCFFFLGMILVTASYTMSWTSVHSSSGTLLDLIPWINFSFPLYNHKRFDLGHTWMVKWFSLVLQFKSEFGNKEFMIWAIVSSWSCFCWLHRAFPSLAGYTETDISVLVGYIFLFILVNGDQPICGCSVANSLWPYGWQPTTLLFPWDSPGKNIGVVG